MQVAPKENCKDMGSFNMCLTPLAARLAHCIALRKLCTHQTVHITLRWLFTLRKLDEPELVSFTINMESLLLVVEAAWSIFALSRCCANLSKRRMG